MDNTHPWAMHDFTTDILREQARVLLQGMAKIQIPGQPLPEADQLRAQCATLLQASADHIDRLTMEAPPLIRQITSVRTEDGDMLLGLDSAGGTWHYIWEANAIFLTEGWAPLQGKKARVRPPEKTLEGIP